MDDSASTPPLETYSAGYVTVNIYLNYSGTGVPFLDIVIYRKIKTPTGKISYKRGASLKPSDIPNLLQILTEITKFTQNYSKI